MCHGPRALSARHGTDGSPLRTGIDLHVHSRFSDGRYSPARLADLAAAANLRGFALTDHDGLGGLDEAARAARGKGLRLVPGVELSCRCQQHDLHLLGWFVDAHSVPLRRALFRLAEARRRRLHAMIQALQEQGIPLDEEEVLERNDGPVTGRPHLAAALVAAGRARSVQDAFQRWLNPGRPGFIRLDRLPASRAIELIRGSGGVSGIAHPGLQVPDAIVLRLAAQGLDAIEVDHPSHDPRQRRHYRALARRLDLTPAAGSDFHGDRQRHARLGAERLSDAGQAALEARRPGGTIRSEDPVQCDPD
ncbi:MAG: PHP domain-containing protein [Acidobacteriota bacterium]